VKKQLVENFNDARAELRSFDRVILIPFFGGALLPTLALFFDASIYVGGLFCW
jgi:hypothetical protein